MRDHLAYLRYVLWHKWFVWQASRRVHVPWWRAMLHDWSKFLPSEWTPYVHHFYTPTGGRNQWVRESDDAPFNQAWNYHQKRQPHHWQYWVLRLDDGGTTALPMPEAYVREMVADWIGAGRAITGRNEVQQWYAQHWGQMILHPNTRSLVEQLLDTVAPPAVRAVASPR